MKKITIINWVKFLFIASLFQLIFIAQLSNYLEMWINGIFIHIINFSSIYILACFLIKKWVISECEIRVSYPIRFLNSEIVILYSDVILISYVFIVKYSNILQVSTKFGRFSIDVSKFSNNNAKIMSLFSLLKSKDVRYIIKGGGRKIYDEHPPSPEFLKQIEKEELIKKRNELLKIKKKSKHPPVKPNLSK